MRARAEASLDDRRLRTPNRALPAVLALSAPAARAIAAQSTASAQDTATLLRRHARRGVPSPVAGHDGGQVTVRARNVETPFRIATNAARYLHRATQLNVAMNELSFAPGTPVDSLEVMESVRRLRATGLYSEIILEGSRCPGRRDRFHAVDARRMESQEQPAIRGSRNVARVVLRGERARHGPRDRGGGRERRWPQRADRVARRSAPGRHATPRRRAAAFATSDGRSWIWSLRTREFSDRDVWRAAFTSTQERRLGSDSATSTHIDITKRADALTVSRLVVTECDGRVRRRRRRGTGVRRRERDPARRVARPGRRTRGISRRPFWASRVARGASARSTGWCPDRRRRNCAKASRAKSCSVSGHDLFRHTNITAPRRVGRHHRTDRIPSPCSPATSGRRASGRSDSVQNGTLRTSVALFRKATARALDIPRCLGADLQSGSRRLRALDHRSAAAPARPGIAASPSAR